MVNKKFLLIAGAAIFILIVIIFIFTVKTSLKTPEPTPTPTPIPTITPVQAPGSITQESIKTQLEEYEDSDIKIVGQKNYQNGWAIATIRLEDTRTDDANIVLKREGERWIIIDGPGTDFDPQYLREKGAPESLIEDVNYTL